jgi:predicted dehydrogenase
MIVGKRRTERPIRWAMVGGGAGSQIDYIHRSAAIRDRSFDLVAGAFDIDPDRGRAFGLELGVAESRCYPDYRALFAGEAKRPEGVEAVSIATPNNTHYEIAKATVGFDGVVTSCVFAWEERADESGRFMRPNPEIRR